jgi:hypothetical protein
VSRHINIGLLIEDIQKWYLDAYRKACQETAPIPRPEGLAAKLIEEAVELAIEYGVSYHTVIRLVDQQYEKHYKQEIRVPDLISRAEEAADNFIVWATFVGVAGMWPEVTRIIEAKHLTNRDKRRWRLNEYGGLSHIPAPGHPKAVVLGCDCARMDNGYGQKSWPRHVTNDTCPLHGAGTPWRR